jgi:hypothetical protein
MSAIETTATSIDFPVPIFLPLFFSVFSVASLVQSWFERWGVMP